MEEARKSDVASSMDVSSPRSTEHGGGGAGPST